MNKQVAAFLLGFGLLAVVLINSSYAFPAFHSFTSGNPPIGDGEDYPRSLNPARPVSGGVSPGSYLTTTGVSFNNLNGNPAFFDNNNLLTRPATLINNEAFWTDPRLGQFNIGGDSFELAQFGFDFFTEFTAGSDFGFDLALASVSSDLPTRDFYDELTGNFVSAPFLEFQVQDDNFQTARGTLVFANGESGSSEDSRGVFFANQVGTFNTLNSSRTAYEGRFRIDDSSLRELIEYENSFFDEDPEFDPEGEGDGVIAGPIQFFDIELRDVATLGGTTQVALDNFVLAGASVINDTLREPLTVRPLAPVGENMPQYFTTGDDNPFGDVVANAIDGLIPEVGGLEITSPIEVTPLSDGSQTINTTIYVPGNSELLNEGTEGPLGGISVTYEEPTSEPNVSLMPEETVIGGLTGILSLVSEGIEKNGTLVTESTHRSSGLLGSIANNLTQTLSSELGVALSDLGVDLSTLGQDALIPLSGGELGGILSGLFDGSSSTDLGEVIDSSSGSTGLGGMLGSILKDLPGGESALNTIGQEVLRPFIEGLLSGDGTTAGNLGGLLSNISESFSSSIGTTMDQQLDAQEQEVFNSLLDFINQAQNTSGNASAVIRMVEVDNLEPLQIQAALSIVAPLIEGTEPQYYLNYSYNEYVALLASLGQEPILGDTGGYVESIYNARGQVIDFQFSSWIVTNGSGTFATAVALFSNSAVPEPSSSILLLMAAAGVGIVRRSSRA